MKVVCVGELLIDFVCTDQDVDLAKGHTFVKEAGGAPANVAACIAKLGGESYFVGTVGKDPFGTFLIQMLANFGVSTQYTDRVDSPTTLAFVSLFEDGQRDFVFNRGADQVLKLDNDTIKSLCHDSILHLGSATALLDGTLFDSYLAIARFARQNQNPVCFDPNFRIDLWRDNETVFVERCKRFLTLANIVKVSEEELELLTGTKECRAACLALHDYGIEYVLVTLGKEGCLISTKQAQSLVPALKIKAIDTTGAGDAFIGAFLYCHSQQAHGSKLSLTQVEEYAKFASKVSAVVCTRLGAMSSLPTQEELESVSF